MHLSNVFTKRRSAAVLLDSLLEVHYMKTIFSLFLTAILFLSSACAESATGALQEMYAQGELLMVQGDYAGAAAKFDALGTYSDASQMAMYCKAIAAAETFGLYSMAVDAFIDLGDFKDSKQMAKYYEGRAHEAAGTIDVATASDGDLAQALWQLEEAEKVYGGLAFFKDSLTRYGACGDKIKEIKGEQSRRAQIKRDQELARMEVVYQDALALEQKGDYAEAIKLYRSLNGYKDSVERIAICETAILDGKYDAAVALMEEGKYSEAIAAFTEIVTHRDSADLILLCRYNAAVVLMNAAKYSEAYDAFIALDGYKDSKAQADSIREKANAEKLAKAEVGGYITFGTYEQDNNTGNGQENIEWLVLAKENNRLLVISRYALDCKPYHTKNAEVTWGNCSLRKWMNSDFFNAAFTYTEQTMIPTVSASVDASPSYSNNPGKTTQDKMFLLSNADANKYFQMDGDRKCRVTAYADAQGTPGNDSGFCFWWLRYCGEYDHINMLNVVPDGRVLGYGGIDLSNLYEAVRPAMWIELTP